MVLSYISRPDRIFLYCPSRPERSALCVSVASAEFREGRLIRCCSVQVAQYINFCDGVFILRSILEIIIEDFKDVQTYREYAPSILLTRA